MIVSDNLSNTVLPYPGILSITGYTMQAYSGKYMQKGEVFILGEMVLLRPAVQ